MINDLNYSCEEIANAIRGNLFGANILIKGISTNSKERSETPFCFFAINGEKHNGADYINEAIYNGAKLIVTEEKKGYPVSVIYVENVVTALGLLGKYHKGKTKVIGVTGSQGKTTVKDMITSVLSTKFNVISTHQNNNNEIGVAKTLLSIKGEDYCVVEMGMRGKGEIEWLSYISEPEISVITNCGKAHIGRLKNQKNIFKAKMEILNHTSKYAILPNEKRFIKAKKGKINSIYVGKDKDCKVTNICRENDAISFEINSLKLEINSPYVHDADNAAYAYMAGKLCGISDNEIKEGLKFWHKAEGRGKIINYRGLKIINDTYNASYESMESAIITLSEYGKKGNKTVAILGDMLELGKRAERLHYKIGKLCKNCGIDKLFVSGAYSQNILDGYGGGDKFNSTSEAVELIKRELNPSYVVLVKAGHAKNYGEIIDKLREN